MQRQCHTFECHTVFLTISTMHFTGSNLKFKMTEFGTLEIVSTISTEKGESEWSTASQSNQESSSNKTDETSTQVLVIKKGQEGMNFSCKDRPTKPHLV